MNSYYDSNEKVYEARSKFHDSEFELQKGTTSTASVESAKKALKKAQAQSKGYRMSAARAQLRWGDLHANVEQSRKSWGSAVKEYTKALKALPAEVQKAIISVFFIDSSEAGYYYNK